MNTENNRFSKKALAHLVTGKRVLWFTLAWFIGVGLLTIAITDLFTESIFQKQYLPLLILMAANTIIILRMWQVYMYKTKRLKP